MRIISILKQRYIKIPTSFCKVWPTYVTPNLYYTVGNTRWRKRHSRIRVKRKAKHKSRTEGVYNMHSLIPLPCAVFVNLILRNIRALWFLFSLLTLWEYHRLLSVLSKFRNCGTSCLANFEHRIMTEIQYIIITKYK